MTIAAAFVGLAALVPQLASAADGTITFKGDLADVTCTIKPGPGATGGSDMTVQMPKISVSALAEPGKYAGSTPFSVQIGGPGEAKCADGKIARIWWETTQSPLIDTATGRLNNDVSGAAGVQVSVFNDEGAEMNLYQNSNPSTAVIENNTAILKYSAQYFSNNGGIEAGTVNTSAVFSMHYN